VPFTNTNIKDSSAHLPAAVTKTELFDVYSTHTKDCIHCMKGTCLLLLLVLHYYFAQFQSITARTAGDVCVDAQFAHQALCCVNRMQHAAKCIHFSIGTFYKFMRAQCTFAAHRCCTNELL
jgi:hypothetical protein